MLRLLHSAEQKFILEEKKVYNDDQIAIPRISVRKVANFLSCFIFSLQDLSTYFLKNFPLFFVSAENILFKEAVKLARFS